MRERVEVVEHSDVLQVVSCAYFSWCYCTSHSGTNYSGEHQLNKWTVDNFIFLHIIIVKYNDILFSIKLFFIPKWIYNNYYYHLFIIDIIIKI